MQNLPAPYICIAFINMYNIGYAPKVPSILIFQIFFDSFFPQRLFQSLTLFPFPDADGLAKEFDIYNTLTSIFVLKIGAILMFLC